MNNEKNNYFYGKNILVTGGTGMIGRVLVKILLEKKAKVTVVSLDKDKLQSNSIKFINADLRDFNQCLKLSKNMDIVFQLAGIKGSPAMTSLRPASFFVPTMMISINMMEAARRNNVKKYLYTSSVGVYSPSDLFKEDDVWKIKSSLNKKMSNTKIDNLYEFSKSQGALSMKILGAGGGGFAAIFLKKGFKRKFLEKIKNHKFMEIKIDEVGAKLINFT